MQRDYAELITYSDSEEEFQAAIQASLSETVSTGRIEKCPDSSEVVIGIREKVAPDKGAMLLNVVRGKVLDGASRAIKRPSFDPQCSLSVKFMDDVGTTEGAIDEGGPRREFFSLVAREINDSPMFSGPTGDKFIIPNQRAMDKDLYLIVGVLISLSLAHGGAAPRIFSEKMYSLITQGPNFIKSSIVLADFPVEQTFTRSFTVYKLNFVSLLINNF